MAVQKKAAPKAKLGASPAKGKDMKQVRLVAMLKRPEGATIAQMAKAFGWERHTLRGALSGALKKKLGLKIVSQKPDDGEPVYRVA